MEIIEMHIEFFSEGQNKNYLSLKYHSDYILLIKFHGNYILNRHRGLCLTYFYCIIKLFLII